MLAISLIWARRAARIRPDPQLAWSEMHIESNLSSNKETEILPKAEPAQ